MSKRPRVWIFLGLFLTVCGIIYLTNDTSPQLPDDAPQPLHINFPRPQESLLEPLRFSSWDDNSHYEPSGSPAAHLHTTHEGKMITAARAVADAHVRNGGGVFQSGRHRLLPEGVEYDLQYQMSNGHVTRVTMFQPLENPKLVHSSTHHPDAIVNIVLPLQGRLSTMATFLDHLVTKVLPFDAKLTLTVVYFKDYDYQDTLRLMDSKLGAVDGFKWSLVAVNDTKFSRGQGLQIGVKNGTVHAEDLVFFCDVDILMKPDFFSRCRANAVLGHQVYYPIVFSLYNPSLVYPLMDRKVPPTEEQLHVGEENGFWRDFGFGMACVHRGDLDYQGGLSFNQGWGGEDVALYEAFLKFDGIKVNRAPDPSLFHVYHSKQCTSVQDISYPSCLRSKALTEGSQLQLGMMLIKLHDGADLEGILSKRYYYLWLIPFFSVLLFLSVFINCLQSLILCKYFSRRKYQL